MITSKEYQTQLGELIFNTISSAIKDGEGFTWKTCEQHINLCLKFLRNEISFSSVPNEDITGASEEDELSVNIDIEDNDKHPFSDGWGSETTPLSELIIVDLKRWVNGDVDFAESAARTRAAINRSLDIVDAWVASPEALKTQ